MATTIRTTGALTLAVVLVFCGPTTAQEETADAELRMMVQLPVAVARAVEAGASAGEVSALMHELRLARAPAADVIEILRVAPVAADTRFPTRLGGPDAGGFPLSERAAFFRNQGLYGAALAREIRSELRAQGIPAGEAIAQRGPPPISRSFIPEPAPAVAPGRAAGADRGQRRGTTGGDANAPPARAGEPPRGPPAEAEMERGPGSAAPGVGEAPGERRLEERRVMEPPPDGRRAPPGSPDGV